MIKIYTDGSYIHQDSRSVGAWVAIIFIGEEKKVLEGMSANSTHNRMELSAILNALEYVKDRLDDDIKIFTDSQYAVQLQFRKDKLKATNFLTKKGSPIQNSDLVKHLISFLETLKIELIKVKAHDGKRDETDFNREADMTVRRLVRKHKS